MHYSFKKEKRAYYLFGEWKQPAEKQSTVSVDQYNQMFFYEIEQKGQFNFNEKMTVTSLN